jgi:RNA polymerase primary sigma factor
MSIESYLPEPDDSNDTRYTPDSMRDYLNTIGKAPLLNDEQVVELSKDIEAGLFAGKVLLLREAENPEDILPEIHQQIRRATELKLKGATNTKTKESYEKGEDRVKKSPKTELSAAQKQRACETADVGVARIAAYAADESISSEELQTLVEMGTEAKSRMIASNLRLVVSISKEYRFRAKKLSFVDITQDGNLGLIRAVEKYDYSKGFKFSTYATQWIRQAITRAIADSGRTIRVPVYAHEKINSIHGTSIKLAAELNREPSDEEIAEKVQMPVGKVRELRKYDRDVVSLNKLIGDDGRDSDTEFVDILQDSDAVSPFDYVHFMEKRQIVESLLMELSVRDAEIIRYRFGFYGSPPTLDELSGIYGITREAIRQIEKRALHKFKTHPDAPHLRELLGDV